MIRVHEDQLESLERAVALERFEDEMVAHLHRFSPKHAEIIGDDCLRRAIRLGVERAAAYGVTNTGLLRFYVELMVMLGSMFDVDPLHSWASDVLRDPGIPDEVVRIDSLYDAMVRYFDAVRDPKHGAPIHALRNFARFLEGDVSPAELRAPRTALDTLARIYPERCAYLGEEKLLELIRRGPDAAARNDMATDRGVAVVIGLLFVIGPGFAEDPLYPWVAATLRDPAIKTPERRAERLQKRTQIFMSRALEYLEGKRTDVVL